MFTQQEFIRILTIEHGMIHTQTEGLTTADSLIQPQPTGNCMNWVLGHLLDNQITLLGVLGQESPVDPAEVEIYRRESDPITGELPGVLPLERLLAGHDQVQAALVARLNEMSEADFAREIPFRERMVTVSWRALFLNFHFTYHTGQLELLRQMAGHSEKLI